MKISTLISLACIIATPLAIADDHSSSSPEWSTGAPLEMYNCSFTEGVNGYEQSQSLLPLGTNGQMRTTLLNPTSLNSCGRSFQTEITQLNLHG